MTYEGNTGFTPPIERELTASEQARKYVADFFYGLLDGHDFIVEQLHDKALHNYSSEGYVGELSRVPEQLHNYLQIDLDQYPEQGEVTASLEFSVSPKPDRKFKLDSILLEPEDRASLFLTNEHSQTIISSGGNMLYAHKDTNLMSQTLRSLVPFIPKHLKNVEIEDEVIARAIFDASTATWHTAEIKDGAVYLQVNDYESAHETKRRIDLQVSHLHPCGKTVLLKTSAEESLDRALFNVGSERSLILGAGRLAIQDRVERVDGRLIPVNVPRPPHVTVLRKGIDGLLGKSWPKDSTLGSVWTTSDK